MARAVQPAGMSADTGPKAITVTEGMATATGVTNTNTTRGAA
ncbi:hypothetical protein [Nguyenibacter sp. L1]|nr:hypothetical protein [Nguyenibacter sp. L1]WRH86884.1 hypothetical protein QN315_12850 [Nguyenibacter sp. L1]